MTVLFVQNEHKHEYSTERVGRVGLLVDATRHCNINTQEDRTTNRNHIETKTAKS